jgi:hypothetical protein
MLKNIWTIAGKYDTWGLASAVPYANWTSCGLEKADVGTCDGLFDRWRSTNAHSEEINPLSRHGDEGIARFVRKKLLSVNLA